MWLCQNIRNVMDKGVVPDVILNGSLQGIGAMRQRCVVCGPDVQFIKVLDQPDIEE